MTLERPAISPFPGGSWIRTWAFTAAVGLSFLVLLFAGYEIAERAYLVEHYDVHTLFVFHIYRGVGASVVLASWAFYNIWRTRRRYDTAFQAAYRVLEEAVAARTRELERAFTEQKHLEAQVRHQEKMAALGMLAAGIAHDIGNPLASLSSELEMLSAEDDASKVRESVSVVRKHVARIARTLRDMTDFARRRGEEKAILDVNTAVQDALRMVGHDPRTRRIRVETDLATDLPTVSMVEDQLVLVLVNLLLNAYDAIAEGGTVTIRTVSCQGAAVIEVRDTGTGMTEEVRRRATEPLFTTKARGTGLGLSVSLGVVRSAGGVLEIESAPGEGTVVRLTFPPQSGGARQAGAGEGR